MRIITRPALVLNIWVVSCSRVQRAADSVHKLERTVLASTSVDSWMLCCVRDAGLVHSHTAVDPASMPARAGTYIRCHPLDQGQTGPRSMGRIIISRRGGEWPGGWPAGASRGEVTLRSESTVSPSVHRAPRPSAGARDPRDPGLRLRLRGSCRRHRRTSLSLCVSSPLPSPVSCALEAPEDQRGLPDVSPSVCSSV